MSAVVHESSMKPSSPNINVTPATTTTSPATTSPCVRPFPGCMLALIHKAVTSKWAAHQLFIKFSSFASPSLNASYGPFFRWLRDINPKDLWNVPSGLTGYLNWLKIISLTCNSVLFDACVWNYSVAEKLPFLLNQSNFQRRDCWFAPDPNPLP